MRVESRKTLVKSGFKVLKVEVEETTFCQRLELVEQRSKNAS